MKQLLTILCLVLLSSYSYSEEVPFNQLVERQGITYKISTTPFTGTSVSYHENGQLSTKVNIKNGKPDGLWEGFYENGQLKERGNKKDGLSDGLTEWYKDDGSVWVKQCYKNGIMVSNCEK